MTATQPTIDQMRFRLADLDPNSHEYELLSRDIQIAELRDLVLARRGLTHAFMGRGRALVLESGIIVVPYESHPRQSWNAVVIGHTPDCDERTVQSYGVGGHHICISDTDIMRAKVATILEAR